MYLPWLRRVLVIIFIFGFCFLGFAVGLDCRPAWSASAVEIVPNGLSGGSSAAFSPDGRQVVSGGGLTATVRLWDVATGRLLRTFLGHSESVNSVAFSPDGATIASGAQDDTIKLWDTTTGRLLRTLPQKGVVSSISFSSDGKRLYFASNGPNVLDIATGQIVRQMDEFYALSLAAPRD